MNHHTGKSLGKNPTKLIHFLTKGTIKRYVTGCHNQQDCEASVMCEGECVSTSGPEVRGLTSTKKDDILIAINYKTLITETT